MDKIILQGQWPLKGKVKISGSKNASLPILAATILADGPVTIDNVPHLSDVKTMMRLLEGFGMKVSYRNHQCKTQPAPLTQHLAHYDLVRTMRASILVLGPLVAKVGKAVVSLPGGCAIGARPVNLHLVALEKLGAKIHVEHGYIHAEASQLQGAPIHFDIVTVTGTENAMMAACLAQGTTVITNAACEPEVVDLAHMLKAMGAKIEGEGTPTITIEGVLSLKGCKFSVMPDRIEAGTFLIGACMTGGEITLENANPHHLTALIDKLKMAGAIVENGQKQLKIRGPKEIRPVDISTSPYPNFPTDFQAQFMALMALAKGESVIEENIFENRFMHVSELNRMGADIHLQGNKALIKGVPKLSGAPIMATDLRASACLVLAGLAAEGITEISRVYHIDRGYEGIEKKFRNVGAKVRRIKVKYRF